MTIVNSVFFAKFEASDPQEGEMGEVCIANISPRERQMRLRFGITQFMISLIVLGVLLAFDVNPVWRLLLILSFGGAAAGYFQAKDKT